MPITPTTHADVTVKEQPGSPHWSNSEAGYRVRRLYTGLYSALFTFANTLTRGAQMADLGNAVRIYDWDVKHTGKGFGALEVTLHGLQQPNPRYAVTTGELQQSLYLHKRYNAGGAQELDNDDKLDIRYWEDEPDYTLKSAFRYRYKSGETWAERTLSTQAQEFAGKLLKGQDSFLLDAPIVTAVEQSFDEPTTTAAHVPETPPSGSNYPTGYIWMKMTDDKICNGAIWIRTRTWQALHVIDGDIYS